jgi:DNA-directed RNA polymerase subunit RPC12/RpoP
MTNYDIFENEVKQIARETGRGSDFIASLLANKNPELIPENFARLIRSRGWLDTAMVNFPKVFLFDLETSPIVAYLWSKYQDGISDKNIIRDWQIISWAGKWLFEDKVYSEKCTGQEMLDNTDKRITQSLWEKFEEADILIAHNLDKFDKRKANARFFINGLMPPSPYQTIDTLKHSRRNFAFTSHRLDYIAQDILGLKGKDDAPYELWSRSMDGDEDAISKMDIYCQQDVRVLEDVYLALRPWIKPHPNVSLWTDSEEYTCAACGSEKLTELDNPYRTYVSVYASHRCDHCGHINRVRKATKIKDFAQKIMVSIPR